MFAPMEVPDRSNCLASVRDTPGDLSAWFKVPGSRFTVEGKADSRFLTVNHEPKTLIRYAVYDFGSIINPAELLPEIEPCRFIQSLT